MTRDHPVCRRHLEVRHHELFNFLCFSQTAAQICDEFCVDVPLVDIYQVCENRGATLIFDGIMCIFVQFLYNS